MASRDKINKFDSLFKTSHLKKDMKHRAIRGGMITSASQGVMFFLRIASTVVLARMLIPEYFGLIGMVTALTILIERFQDLGLGDAIVQNEEITHEQVSTLFWINLAICTFFAITVALSAKAVAWFYDDQRLIWITVAFSINFVFSGSAIQHQALIRRQMHFNHFAIIKVISTIFGFVVAIILAWLGYGYWSLVWKELARTILSTLLAWLLCPWRPSLPVRNSGVRSMLKFGYNVTGYNILFYLTNNLDSILIGKFFGAVPLGLYSRAKQLTTMPMSQLLEPIKYVSLPALGALQNDHDKYRKYFGKMLSTISFLYMPIIVYIGIYSHPIVFLTLGPQWMDVVPIFRLLAISMLVRPVVTLLGLPLLSSGLTKRYFIWGAGTSLLLVIAFVGGSRWGAIGVAASWPIATVMSLLFSLFFVFEGTPVNLRSTLNLIYKPMTASVIMGIVLIQTYSSFASFNTLIQILLSLSLAAGMYFFIWMLFPGGYNNIIEFASYPITAMKNRNKTSL